MDRLGDRAQFPDPGLADVPASLSIQHPIVLSPRRTRLGGAGRRPDGWSPPPYLRLTTAEDRDPPLISRMRKTWQNHLGAHKRRSNNPLIDAHLRLSAAHFSTG